jgi:hypothetical protein
MIILSPVWQLRRRGETIAFSIPEAVNAHQGTATADVQDNGGKCFVVRGERRVSRTRALAQNFPKPALGAAWAWAEFAPDITLA